MVGIATKSTNNNLSASLSIFFLRATNEVMDEAVLTSKLQAKLQTSARRCYPETDLLKRFSLFVLGH